MAAPGGHAGAAMMAAPPGQGRVSSRPMRYLILAIRALLTLAAGWLAGLTGYLLLLTGAGVLGRQELPPDATRRRRFALLVPAHDEESTIGRLLASVRALDY